MPPMETEQMQPKDSTLSPSQKQGTAQTSDQLPRGLIESLRQEAKDNTIKMRELLRKAPNS